MKSSAYVIEIEQCEKDTRRTMYNTRHELAKLITQNGRLQQENKQLKKQKDDVVEYIKNRFDADKGIWIIDCYELLRMLGEIDEQYG